MSEHEQTWTEREVAELLRVTVRTLSTWRRNGEGPPWVRAGGTIRYVRLNRWLDGEFQEEE